MDRYVLIDTETRKRLSPQEEASRFEGVLGYRSDPNFDLSRYNVAWAKEPREYPPHPLTERVYLSDTAQEVNGEMVFPFVYETVSQSEKERLIRREANRRLRALAKDYDEEERETWSTQVNEAKAIKAGGTAQDAPMLSIFAARRGITLDAMADRVLFLSSQFAQASALILSKRDTLLEMAETPDDFNDDKWWTP